MDNAKNAVKDFMSKAGHNDTTVHEKVAPAVTHETQHTHRHEEIQTAVDKEVHQDHYHTSVQPVLDRQTLPEQHHHNLGAVEHRQFEHGNDREVEQRLLAEQAKFKDEVREGKTKHTTSEAPVVAGEHIHHHVHENIQPVVNRETVQPHVVHTTVPIHEVHHNSAQHHTTSALPAVSMNDFKKQGGVLTGREERYDGFEGEPRSMTGGATSGTSTTGRLENDLEGRHAGTTGTTGSGLGGNTTTGTSKTGRLENELEGRNAGTTGTSGSGLGRDTTGTGAGLGSNSATDTTGTDSTGAKPSLLNKLNPMTDSNGDGKAGFMK